MDTFTLVDVVTDEAVEPRVSFGVTSMALHALEVGAEHGYTYLILPHTGMIEDRVVKLGWYYHPRRMEKNPIPGMADKLAKPIYDAGIPVAVEAVGHEIEFVNPNQETNHNKLIAVGLGVAIATAVATVAVVSLIAPPVAVAAAPAVTAPTTTAATLLAVGAVAAVDPSLVLILSDGPNGEGHTWIQCASWVDF